MNVVAAGAPFGCCTTAVYVTGFCGVGVDADEDDGEVDDEVDDTPGGSVHVGGGGGGGGGGGATTGAHAATRAAAAAKPTT